jgi:hypothetical protein
MPARERLYQPFIGPRQAAKARRPRVPAFYCQMPLRAPTAFCAIIPGPGPTFGVDGTGRLSKVAAAGSALRPCVSRNTARRSGPYDPAQAIKDFTRAYAPAGEPLWS